MSKGFNSFSCMKFNSTEKNYKQGYLTTATNSIEFLNYAINLRLSCFYNDPTRPFALVADETIYNRIYDLKISHYFDNIILYQGNYVSWELKFELIHLSPFDETFYIDADSLMIKDPNSAWSLVSGKHFTVQGPENFEGKWYGRTQKDIMSKMKISYFPKFNGGFLYFDKSQKAREVFKKSVDLFNNYYEELGFDLNHGLKADEPIIGIAMALCNLKPEPDSSNIMFTILGIDFWFGKFAKLKLSIPKRKVYFKKYNKAVSPIILHCCSGLRDSWHYRRAERQLKNIVKVGKNYSRI